MHRTGGKQQRRPALARTPEDGTNPWTHRLNLASLEQYLCSTRRKATSALRSSLLGRAFRRSRHSIVSCAPLNEVLPENDPLKDGKARQMKPVSCRRIRHTSADGKFLGVQCLIQTALLHDRVKSDALQLPVRGGAFGPPCIVCAHSC